MKGGFIVFDDYGMHGADGIKKLIKKLLKIQITSFILYIIFKANVLLSKNYF